jgi:hypothetical protein
VLAPPVAAAPAHDAWALGATLFLMLTGVTMVWSDTLDNAKDAAALREIAEWPAHVKEARLGGAALHAERVARNLLWRLLERDPAKRLTLDRVLSHPFVTGKPSGRLPGEPWLHDVFLSYRQRSDAGRARLLAGALRARGVRVWWDADSLPTGQDWLVSFCGGLRDACLFVPLLSRDAVGSWAALRADSPCDNVLLEHRLALEMREMGLLRGVCPVLAGDANEHGVCGDFFAQGCAPTPSDAVVDAVEEEAAKQLDTLGLGSKLFAERVSVAGVWGAVTKNQGCFWMGDPEAALEAIVSKVVASLALAKGATAE